MSKDKGCPFCGSNNSECLDHLDDCYLKLLAEENLHRYQYSPEILRKAWNTRVEDKDFASTKKYKTQSLGEGFPDVPIFKAKGTDAEAYYQGKDKAGRSLFEDYRGCEYYIEDVEPIIEWYPQVGEKVLFEDDNHNVLIGIYHSRSRSLFNVDPGGYYSPTDKLAQYDRTLPVPETWEDVKKQDNVLTAEDKGEEE